MALEYAVAGGIGQILGMIAGLIYVRLMPMDQYALYALAMVSFSFINVISDLGLTGSTTYFWRHSISNRLGFHSYFVEIKRARLILLIFSLLIALSGFVFLGIKREFAHLDIAVAIILLTLTAFSTVNSSIDLQVLRLAGEFRKTYLYEFAGQALRFCFAGCFLLGLTASALFGLAGGLAGAWVIQFSTWRWGKPRLHLFLGDRPEHPRRQLRRYILPMAPGVGVFAFQDMIVMWLAALFASKMVIAEVFALGRIAAIASILNAFIIKVIVPRISNISDKKHFLNRSFIVVGAITILALTMLSISYLWPANILWLLGASYDHLSDEVVIVVVTSGVVLLNTTFALLNRVRGWVRLEPLSAILQIISLVLLYVFGDFETTRGVVTIVLLLSCWQLLLSFSIGLLGIFMPRFVQLDERGQ